MTPRRRLLLAVLLTTAACARAVNGGSGDGLPGDTIWRQEIEMLEGQVAHIDSRALSVYLEDTAVDSAVVTLTMAGVERTVTLRTGLAGEETMPPYAIRLLYTGVNDGATLEVAKFRQ